MDNFFKGFSRIPKTSQYNRHQRFPDQNKDNGNDVNMDFKNQS